MLRSKEERDERDAERWLTRSGGLGFAPSGARYLLVLRLRARRRAGWICFPLVLLSVVLLVSLFLSTPAFADDAQSQWFVGGDLLVVGLLVGSVALITELAHRGEARIPVPPELRVARDDPAPLWQILGRVRLAVAAITMTFQVAFGAALIWAHLVWIGALYVIGVLVVWAISALSVARTVRGASIAVDAFSLAIDERLRSQDAFNVTGPPAVMLLIFPAFTLLEKVPPGLAKVWILGLLALQGLWLWAQARPPWKPRLRGHLSAR
jgi:hypothetical protein